MDMMSIRISAKILFIGILRKFVFFFMIADSYNLSFIIPGKVPSTVKSVLFPAGSRFP